MFGALLLASTGAFVSCTDYDDDIKGLQEQIDANKKSIDAIQALLNSGQWVKSVTPNSNGVTITMGDGKTFEITNGADGIAGQAGSVITMGENGNWLIDGVDSGKSWKGDKGNNGTDGKDGADGTNGKDGADGITPHVGANGNWFIGTTDTGVKAQGIDGTNGTNGTNGKDGVNGTNGTNGLTPHIGGNGHWFIGTTDTGVPAKGTNGTNGTNGKNGVDGKDGAYYVPNTDGFWYKYEIVNGKLVTTKGERWRVEEVVTAVYNEKDNMIVVTYGTDGSGKAQTVSFPISHTVALQSIAFVPDVMKDGVGVVDFYTVVKNDKVISSNNPTVSYRLNPTNASVKDVKSWAFLNRAVEMRTRAAGDAADLISYVGEPGYSDGTVNFKLVAKKLPTAGKADLFALKATETINNETFDIVSDYAQVANTQLKDFVIADTIQTKEKAKFVDFSKTLKDVKDVEAYIGGDVTKPNPLVHSFVYTGSINLKDLVGTYTTTNNINKYLADLGFYNVTYKFTKEREYIDPNDKNTDQQKFVTLTDSENLGTVTVNKEWLSQGTAAVGRTPIFKVEAKVAGTVIATAYIKLRIAEVEEDTEDKLPLPLEVECGDIQYTDIDGTNLFELGWDVMNQKVYDKLGLTNVTFFEKYNEPVGSIVTGVEGYYSDKDTETASTFAWIKFNNQVKLGKGEYVVTYPSKNKKVYPDVVITFTYNIVHPACKLALNPDYMIGGKDIIAVKGRLEGSAYEMISGMNEHFKDYLKNFVALGNHKAYAFRLKPNNPPTYHNATGVEVTAVAGVDKTSFKNQEIKLTAPMTTATKDVDVQLVITLENGQQEIQDYVVRFINPFIVSVDEAKLKTLTSQADTKELSKLITIKDTQNKLLYNKDGWTDAASTIYKLTASSGVTFVYDLVYNTVGDDTEASFGGRLTLDADGTLTWDNKGADLQRSKSAASRVTVTIPKLATIVANGKITVLSTELSK